MTFDPDIATMALIPVATNPVSMGVWWLDIVSGDPDVTVAVPAVIAVMPSPAGVLVGWSRDNFDGAWGRWSNPYDDLGLCKACNK